MDVLTRYLSSATESFANRMTRRALAALLFGICATLTFAAGTLELSEFARSQINALVQEKESRTPTQQKIDSQILRTMDALSASPRYPILLSVAHPVPDAKGVLEVDVDLFNGGDLQAAMAAIRSANGKVKFASASSATVRAFVPVSMLETLAADPAIRFIGRKGEARSNKVNTSEGDRTHKVDQVRNLLGYTGLGQKICVLSDAIDSLRASQATGDLPPDIYVLPGMEGSGGDEGTAMLEIVHDLAPGAKLGFATAFISQASFAQNIRDLANPAIGACNIIVDDIGYFKESPFQDNDVAEAVNAVTAAGVAYFSAAGNEGNITQGTGGTWEGDFVTGAANALIPGHDVHLWAAGQNSNQATLGSGPVILHWADPFGSSSNDYDLYVLNSAGSAVIASSTNTQSGTQDPFEIVDGANTGERIVVARKTSAATRIFNMQLSRGELTYANAGSTRGHNSTVDGFGVAATPAAVSFGAPTPNGPYPNPFIATNQVESFSSDGPRRMFFAFSGSLLPGAPAGVFTAAGGVIRNKPDVTAADGVSTAAPGFSTFYGTSAAAPHAAAIAGLLKQASPTMTLAQMRTALTTNALDIMGAGLDRDSGYGILRPLETLQAMAAPTVPALALGAVTRTQIAGNGDANVDPNEDWKLDIVLNNVGPAAASVVSATLVSMTPGVVVTTGAVSYGTLAATTGTASNPAGTPFRFSMMGASCGPTLKFKLVVTYAGAPAPREFGVYIPTTGTVGSPTTYTYSGAVVPIPDGSPDTPAVANVTVAGGATNIGNVTFRVGGATCSTVAGATTVGIDHTYVADLTLKLVAPGGTAVTLWSGRGGSGNNICQTVFSDAAATSVSALIASNNPYTGTYRPETPLADLIGLNANGVWSLRAADSFATDSGSIRAFSFAVSPLTCAAVSNSVATTATKTVTGTYFVGNTVTYTVTLANAGPGVQADNAGDEYVDVLPSQLTLVSATSTRGVTTTTGNTAKWNGALEAGASVTITITATINAGTVGQTVTSQGTFNYDADHNGSNEASRLTDDPALGGATDPTSFVVQASVTQPVSVTFNGSGTGTSSSATAGLSCAANCATAVTQGSSVTVNAVPTGGSVFTGWLGAGCTGTGACTFVANSATTLSATFAPPGTVATLDIDASAAPTKYDAATDGVMALRALFGMSGVAISNDARGGTATRSPAAIPTYLADIAPVLDANGDGQVQALTDGVLIIRYLLGLRGTPLIAGIPLVAARPTFTDIQNYLATLTP